MRTSPTRWSPRITIPAGKMGGANHVRLRNLDTGTLWEHSFRAELKLEELSVERHTLEFLYEDGGEYVFARSCRGSRCEYSAAHPRSPDSTWKPAALGNGVKIMVPPFVKPGDSIRLFVPELKYMDRARAKAG